MSGCVPDVEHLVNRRSQRPRNQHQHHAQPCNAQRIAQPFNEQHIWLFISRPIDQLIEQIIKYVHAISVCCIS